MSWIEEATLNGDGVYQTTSWRLQRGPLVYSDTEEDYVEDSYGYKHMGRQVRPYYLYRYYLVVSLTYGGQHRPAQN